MKIFSLTLLSVMTIACASQPVTPVPIVSDPDAFQEEDVRFRSEGLELAGLLLTPGSAGPHPAAMFIQGSGDSDRNNFWARSIAEALVRRGIVVLLPDKRGTGASEGDWREAGFEDYARDTIAGVELLQRRREVDSRRVGVIGLSQGGHVAPLAAHLSDEIAFVIDVSGSATTPVDQVNHEMRNTFRQAGLPPEGIEAGMALQSLAGQYVRTGEWEPYAAMLSALRDTPLAPLAAEFPQTEDSWVWDWWRGIGDYDPIEYWRSVEQPALVVYGEDDESDNVPVKESVRRLRDANSVRAEPIRIVVYEGSGHAIYATGTTNLRDDFLDLLGDWIHGH